jgi:hypothetical protein
MADSIFDQMSNDETLEQVAELAQPVENIFEDLKKKIMEREAKNQLEENVKYYDSLEKRVLTLERQVSRLLLNLNLYDKSEILITDKMPEEKAE